jgi:hypothetical protein
VDEYEQLDALASRLVDVELEIEDLESSAATREDEAELERLGALRDELRGTVDALQAELHQRAVERLLEAIAAEANG